MKECKILRIATNNDFSTLQIGSLENRIITVLEFPQMEKALEKYLNEGFIVKCMTQEQFLYTFYLERDV